MKTSPLGVVRALIVTLSVFFPVMTDDNGLRRHRPETTVTPGTKNLPISKRVFQKGVLFKALLYTVIKKEYTFSVLFYD